MPGRRISWILLGLAGLIEIQTKLHAANKIVPNQIGRVTASDICVTHLMTRKIIEKNNSLIDEREYESRMRGWRGSSAGGREAWTEWEVTSHAQKELLAIFFVPDRSILVTIIIEVCARACEERVTVVSMASNASTDINCKTSNKMCQRPSPCERVCRNWSVLVLRVRVTESVAGNQQKIVQNISICLVNHAGERTCVVIRCLARYRTTSACVEIEAPQGIKHA